MTPEGKVKAAIKKVLKKYPSIYYFMPVQGGYGTKTLDFLLCVNTYFVAVEAKAPGKHPTALQWKTIGDIQRAGGVATVIGNLDEVRMFEELIKALYNDHHTRRDPSQPEAQDAGRTRRRMRKVLVSDGESCRRRWDPHPSDPARTH